MVCDDWLPAVDSVWDSVPPLDFSELELDLSELEDEDLSALDLSELEGVCAGLVWAGGCWAARDMARVKLVAISVFVMIFMFILFFGLMTLPKRGRAASETVE
jgi:hypothetical protein